MDSITKICTKCGKEKVLEDFGKQKETPDGRHSWCKECLARARRERYKTRPERETQWALDWQKRNPERVKAISKLWHKTEKSKTGDKRWRKENPEKIKQYKRKERVTHKEYYKEYGAKYYQENKEKHRENGKQWYWKNIERARSLSRIIAHNRRSQLKGTFTVQEWKDLCNKYDNLCLCCGERKKLTQDHVMPVSKGGSNTIDNIQPLCGSCNSSKGTKTIDYR